MENASKALVIAGSIIITLVIVALGVLVVNRLRSTIIDSANMDQQTIDAANQKFEAYLGNNVTAANTKALIKLVASHDTMVYNNEDASDLPVYIVYGNTLYGKAKDVSNITDPSSLSSSIKQGKHYVIEINNGNYNDTAPSGASTAGHYKNGYVKCIKISAASET